MNSWLARRARALKTTTAAVGVLAVALFGVAVTAAPASASFPSCGAVTLSGSSWLGGQGVDVHSNGVNTNTGVSCGSAVYNLNASPSQMGQGWQCVELAQRLYDTRGWHSGGSFGLPYAYQIYDDATNLGFTSQANGSITSIVPGDMVVQGTADTWSSAGHVDVVDYVNGTTVHIVQQNSTSPTATYTLSGGTLSGASGGDIVGVVHSPQNTNTGGSGGGTTASVSSQVTPDGVQHVYNGTASGSVYDTSWGNGASLTTWQVGNVSPAAAIADSSQIVGGVLHVYAETNSGIYDVSWGNGAPLTQWQVN